jgi:hypothetical protein
MANCTLGTYFYIGMLNNTLYNMSNYNDNKEDKCSI